MMEWLANLYDQVKWIHSAEGISYIVGSGGLVALTLIIFSETGLLIGFFLPGDSILIAAGVLANPSNAHFVSELDIIQMNIVLVIAAIVGNQTGYFIGHKVGDKIWQKPDGRFYKRKNLIAAQEFYKKYGAFSVIGARYIPIIRTFVPFVAGMARMPYKKFLGWDLLGGVLWITSMLWIGYYLGQTSLANRLDKIIVIIVFVSVLPMIFGVVKGYVRKKS